MANKKTSRRKVTKKSDDSTSHKYRPRIIWDDKGEKQEAELANWSDEYKAQCFVRWLKKRIEPLRS